MRNRIIFLAIVSLLTVAASFRKPSLALPNQSFGALKPEVGESSPDLSPPIATLPSYDDDDAITPRKSGAALVIRPLSGSGPEVFTTTEGIYRQGTWAAIHWIPDYNPPDANGAPGFTDYVQATIHSYAVYAKDATILKKSIRSYTLWSGFSACGANVLGEPIVVHDQYANRWVISQYSAPTYPSGPFYQCIAVSQTSDPLGSFYRYQFQVSDSHFNNHSRIGVWSDAYYVSANDYSQPSGAYYGADAMAFERSKMLSGQTARFIRFVLSGEGSMLPADADGPNAPPSGAPNYFVDLHSTSLHVSKFHVDWNQTSNSYFKTSTFITVPSYDRSFSCGSNGRSCIPQYGTSSKIDVVSDRLMYRAAYRNFGSYESLVLNHTVDVGSNHAGIRWYELRGLNSTASLYQGGTFTPDSKHRWMGSIAEDRKGNIMLGYSISSTSMYPSMAAAGRNLADTKNSLSSERIIFDGIGSYTHSSSVWGAISDMAVDPADDCTFYYTNEYCCWKGDTTAWRTRVAQIRFPSCLK